MKEWSGVRFICLWDIRPSRITSNTGLNCSTQSTDAFPDKNEGIIVIRTAGTYRDLQSDYCVFFRGHDMLLLMLHRLFGHSELERNLFKSWQLVLTSLEINASYTTRLFVWFFSLTCPHSHLSYCYLLCLRESGLCFPNYNNNCKINKNWFYVL